MTSPARIAANRRNALKSTGPKTPKGKRAVRLNALRHGAFATDPLLPGDDPAAFARLRDGFRRLYRPASPEEEALLQQVVLAAWRLPRVYAMGTRVLADHAAALREAGLLSSPGYFGPPDPLTAAFIADASGPNRIGKLIRCQTMLDRSYGRALNRLRHLIATRHP